MSLDDRIADSIRGAARRHHSLLIRCIDEVSQKRIASLIGVSETTMSGIKSDQLERIAALIAACGLKLSPVTHQTYDEAYIGALKTLASVGLGREPLHEEGRDE